MNRFRAWHGLSVLTLVWSALSVSCTSMSNGGPETTVTGSGGVQVRKGTPTPIVLGDNVQPPGPDDLTRTQWSYTVPWLIKGPASDPVTCYKVHFHFYQLDLHAQTLSNRDGMFLATPQDSATCDDKSKHKVGEPFNVTITHRKFGGVPDPNGSYVIVGTCQGSDEVEATTGSGASLFHFKK